MVCCVSVCVADFSHQDRYIVDLHDESVFRLDNSADIVIDATMSVFAGVLRKDKLFEITDCHLYHGKITNGNACMRAVMAREFVGRLSASEYVKFAVTPYHSLRSIHKYKDRVTERGMLIRVGQTMKTESVYAWNANASDVSLSQFIRFVHK